MFYERLEWHDSQVAWNGIKPNASYLKVSGSIWYVYIDVQMRTKLDEKEQNDDLGMAAKFNKER